MKPTTKLRLWALGAAVCIVTSYTLAVLTGFTAMAVGCMIAAAYAVGHIRATAQHIDDIDRLTTANLVAPDFAAWLDTPEGHRVTMDALAAAARRAHP